MNETINADAHIENNITTQSGTLQSSSPLLQQSVTQIKITSIIIAGRTRPKAIKYSIFNIHF